MQNENLVVVVSTGEGPVDEIRNRFPSPNVMVEPFVPYAAVMSHVSVMITNGGFGGVSTALWHGVPLAVAAESEDKPEAAARVAHCGAGINLKTGRPSPGKVHKAVMKILGDPSYRRNAERVRDDFRKHDAVKESINLIESVIAND